MDTISPIASLASYSKRLSEICECISGVSANTDEALLRELVNTRDFSYSFGYGNTNISALIDKELPYFRSIRKGCLRRTYFYLLKLREAARDLELNYEKLDDMVGRLIKVRRSHLFFQDSNQRDKALLTALNTPLDSNPNALASFYETFIDPELFTTLLLLQERNENREHPIYGKLLDRLAWLASSYIDNSHNASEICFLHSRELSADIMDEANMFWALRIIYENRRDNFAVGRYSGKNGFEKLWKELLSRPSMLDWRFPREDELDFDITPEIYTSERTHLYILFNQQLLLRDGDGLSIEFKKTVSEKAERIIKRNILNGTISDRENLYIACLKAQCLKNYIKSIGGDTSSANVISLSQNGCDVANLKTKDNFDLDRYYEIALAMVKQYGTSAALRKYLSDYPDIGGGDLLPDRKDHVCVKLILETMSEGSSDCHDTGFTITRSLPVKNLQGTEIIDFGNGDFLKEYEKNKYEEIVGLGRNRKRIDELKRIAASDKAVLILGETGTGKELIARFIHAHSGRGPAKERFKPIICKAIPETLIDSTLFGCKKNTHSMAKEDSQGFFEKAHGCTVFLDEIGDIPISTQEKLLRVIQEKEILRIGEDIPREIDIRVISATSKKLGEEKAVGSFRKDLFYRLGELTYELPPLRSKMKDIPFYIYHFLGKEKVFKQIEVKALNTLCNYWWEGNARELQNLIGDLCTRIEGDVIQWCDLPENIREQKSDGSHAFSKSNIMTAVKRRLTEIALCQSSGDKNKASMVLGVSKATFYRYR